MFELEKTWNELNSLRLHEERGAEKDVKSSTVRSLRLIPDFEEKKITEWFRRFEKKGTEFKWPQD